MCFLFFDNGLLSELEEILYIKKKIPPYNKTKNSAYGRPLNHSTGQEAGRVKRAQCQVVYGKMAHMAHTGLSLV